MRTDYEVSLDIYDRIHREGNIADDDITILKYESMAQSQEDVQILHEKELLILRVLSAIMEETDLNEMLNKYGSNTEKVRESDTKHPVDICNICGKLFRKY